MAAKPRVNYFNIKGRGEIIRLTLAAAGIDFEDNRVEREQWPELKKKAPTGVMPWVDAPEGTMVQSSAVARYYARKHGLMGKSDWEYYLVERALAQLDDIWAEMVKVFFLPDDKKPEAVKEFQANKGLSLLTNLEGFLKDGGDSGLFVSSGLTLADIICMHLLDMLSGMMADFVGKFDKLKANNEKVKAVPNVAAWLKKRPQTAM